MRTGINPLDKILHVDLNQTGYNQVQKVEGLTLIDPQTLAVLNGNDFGVASIIVNPDGTFTLNWWWATRSAARPPSTKSRARP